MTDNVKLIIAVVRPHLVDRIVVALEELEGFPGMTVWDSAGFGDRMRGRESNLDPFKANKRIEIIAQPDLVDGITHTIREHARTGKKGDGLVCVVPLESAKLI